MKKISYNLGTYLSFKPNIISGVSLISNKYFIRLNLFLLLICFNTSLYSQIDNLKEYTSSGRGFVFTSQNGNKIKLTPYGPNIIRVQAAKQGEEFFQDNYYEMVESHDWSGKLKVIEIPGSFNIYNSDNSDFKIVLKKNPLRIEIINQGKKLFSESNGIQWKGNYISESFTPEDSEHFTGLGHGYFGLEPGIDLKGRVIGRNYGTNHGDQAPLIVPFYMSSKGYGIFLNSTFTNQFSFNKDGRYSFGIYTYGEPGKLDYFIIAGPHFSTILNQYTLLTGKPRLPPLAIFGLGLSDKSNDENSKDPSDENW